ncbi:MAG: IS91 family transposase [Spirochaetota bacterium]|jgi:hypothetical protein
MAVSLHPEVQDIFTRFGPHYRDIRGITLSGRHYRVMRAIESCRTEALGGHTDRCDRCGKLRVSYNSCRDRHCPKCQFLKREQWLEERQKDMLPIHYFHVVFTLPDILNPLVLRNQKVVYDLLFRSAAESLLELSGDPRHLGADVGFLSILHTWGQNLMDHPHLHCIVTGGGLARGGTTWRMTRRSFFLPVRALSRLFRGKFLDYLAACRKRGDLVFPGKTADLACEHVFQSFLRRLRRKEWVVYLKAPFKNARTVFGYLSRYTHRVAISNSRIVRIDNDTVLFQWRDYSDHGRNKVMRLDGVEFIRRFLLHVLPLRYVKIRYYGILSHRRRKDSLLHARAILNSPAPEHNAPTSWKERLLAIRGFDVDRCPFCGNGRMVFVQTIVPVHCNGPPGGVR